VKLFSFFKKLFLDPKKNPKHIAVIMDGNGRWAQKRHMPRSYGHAKGLNSVQKIIKYAILYKIEALTLYAFSTENSKRPKKEIDDLIKLFDNSISKEANNLLKNNIVLRILGDITFFPKLLQKKIISLQAKCKNNNGLKLSVALNYGGQKEIVNAVNRSLKTKKTITLDDIEKSLDTSSLPKVDLLIRTGGEKRISNFLLWQLAYSELYFVDKLWPDFSEAILIDALFSFQKRKRRFGTI
jgi:undecaprenyl diphosphate synthase